MRLEKAAGPADQALVDHGGFGGLFLSVQPQKLKSLPTRQGGATEK